MSEKKARIYTILIKVAVGVVAAIFLCIFVAQYSNMIKLQNQKDNLNSELANTTQYNEYLQNQIETIQDTDNEEQPSEEYVVDTAHENGYVGEGETYITAN